MNSEEINFRVWFSRTFSDAAEASTSRVLSLHRETQFIIGVDFAVTLSSLASFCVLFDMISEQMIELKWLMLKQTQKMFPLITCRISLRHDINIVGIINLSMNLIFVSDWCEVLNELHFCSYTSLPVLYHSDSCFQELRRTDPINQVRVCHLKLNPASKEMINTAWEMGMESNDKSHNWFLRFLRRIGGIEETSRDSFVLSTVRTTVTDQNVFGLTIVFPLGPNSVSSCPSLVLLGNLCSLCSQPPHQTCLFTHRLGGLNLFLCLPDNFRHGHTSVGRSVGSFILERVWDIDQLCLLLQIVFALECDPPDGPILFFNTFQNCV